MRFSPKEGIAGMWTSDCGKYIIYKETIKYQSNKRTWVEQEYTAYTYYHYRIAQHKQISVVLKRCDGYNESVQRWEHRQFLEKI